MILTGCQVFHPHDHEPNLHFTPNLTSSYLFDTPYDSCHWLETKTYLIIFFSIPIQIHTSFLLPFPVVYCVRSVALYVSWFYGVGIITKEKKDHVEEELKRGEIFVLSCFHFES